MKNTNCFISILYGLICKDKKVTFSPVNNFLIQYQFVFYFSDITTPPLSAYNTQIQQLLCKAHTIGWMSQVNSDGYLPNSRINLSMGLAAIHIAQVMEVSMQRLNKSH